MSRYTAQRYEPLYSKDAERGYDRKEWSKRLGHNAVGLYRTKRVVAGDTLEIIAYPVWDWQREATRAKKANPTEQAQWIQNQRDAVRKLTWVMNTNFTKEDLFITLSYSGAAPTSMREARRDMQAYLRRVKRWRERHGLPELKYIYVIEYQDGDGRKKRVHHHLVMSGMDRDAAEQIWERGRVTASRLQPDEYGLPGLANYIAKTKGKRGRNEKLWCGSRNLKGPTITYSERKISRRDVERIAADEAGMRERLEHKEPGYVLNDVSIKVSEYVPGAYVTARYRRIAPRGRSPSLAPPEQMKRQEGKPRWRS